MHPKFVIQQDQNTLNATIGAVWYQYLNNSFQYLNNNNTSNTYFYNTKTRVFTTLKTEQ